MASKAGFVKAHVTATAYEVRAELGLKPLDRLDPWALAKFLEIPILPLTKFREVEDSGAEYFLHIDTSAFSAVTVFSGPKRVVVHNDAHSKPRQNNNVCHELSHGLLMHEPSPALDDSGLRDWDQVMEDEASFMAGALLVTDQATIVGVRNGQRMAGLALQYGVSTELMRWRINATGAVRRVARGRGRRP